MKLSFGDSFYAGVSDCDMNREITLSRLTQLLFGMAEQNLPALPSSAADKSLIALRSRFVVAGLPKTFERFSVKTELCAPNSFALHSESVVWGENGNRLLAAEIELGMKSTAGRLVRLPAEYAALNAKTAITNTKLSFDNLAFSEAQPLHTRYTDYDKNRHVNNSVYYSYITEYCGVDFRNYRLESLTINYIDGMQYGESFVLKSFRQDMTGGFVLCQRVENERGGCAALMKSQWRERE